jgi:hypothetical protein
MSSTDSQRRPLERFYTPQPQRTMAAGPRRSLASIGGPPTRLARLPETPAGPSSRMPVTPGSLGPPSRKFVPPVDDEEIEDEEVDQAPCTPVKREVNPAILAEVSYERPTVIYELTCRRSDEGRLWVHPEPYHPCRQVSKLQSERHLCETPEHLRIPLLLLLRPKSTPIMTPRLLSQ